MRLGVDQRVPFRDEEKSKQQQTSEESSLSFLLWFLTLYFFSHRRLNVNHDPPNLLSHGKNNNNRRAKNCLERRPSSARSHSSVHLARPCFPPSLLLPLTSHPPSPLLFSPPPSPLLSPLRESRETSMADPSLSTSSGQAVEAANNLMSSAGPQAASIPVPAPPPPPATQTAAAQIQAAEAGPSGSNLPVNYRPLNVR